MLGDRRIDNNQKPLLEKEYNNNKNKYKHNTRHNSFFWYTTNHSSLQIIPKITTNIFLTSTLTIYIFKKTLYYIKFYSFVIFPDDLTCTLFTFSACLKFTFMLIFPRKVSLYFFNFYTTIPLYYLLFVPPPFLLFFKKNKTLKQKSSEEKEKKKRRVYYFYARTRTISLSNIFFFLFFIFSSIFFFSLSHKLYFWVWNIF